MLQRQLIGAARICVRGQHADPVTAGHRQNPRDFFRAIPPHHVHHRHRFAIGRSQCHLQVGLPGSDDHMQILTRAGLQFVGVHRALPDFAVNRPAGFERLRQCLCLQP